MATSTTRRRVSKLPGLFTRAELEADLGISPAERDTFERAGYFGPSERRERGDTRAVHYSAVDLGLARAAVAAHRAGLRGEPLRRVADALRSRRGRLSPGWGGLAVINTSGDVELVPSGGSLDAARGALGQPAVVIVVELNVPPADTSEAAA